MFRIFVLTVPVTILPLLVVQVVETMMTRSLLPEVATEMQRATEREAERGPSGVVAAQRVADEDRAPVSLSLTLRF